MKPAPTVLLLAATLLMLAACAGAYVAGDVGGHAAPGSVYQGNAVTPPP
jgi:heme A synthase